MHSDLLNLSACFSSYKLQFNSFQMAIKENKNKTLHFNVPVFCQADMSCMLCCQNARANTCILVKDDQFRSVKKIQYIFNGLKSSGPQQKFSELKNTSHKMSGFTMGREVGISPLYSEIFPRLLSLKSGSSYQLTSSKSLAYFTCIPSNLKT